MKCYDDFRQNQNCPMRKKDFQSISDESKK